MSLSTLYVGTCDIFRLAEDDNGMLEIFLVLQNKDIRHVVVIE
jgi:hypothetical protein